MLVSETYKRLLLKINKNDTNSDIDISKGEFVLLYNEQKDRWAKEQINDKESSGDIEDLSGIFEKHKELEKLDTKEDYVIFALPDNFFSYVSSYSICSKGACGDVVLYNYRYKPKNENMLLESTNMRPDFEIEETIVDLSNSKLFVYKKDFNVSKVRLNYYRKVGAIDIAGYRKLDGSMSEDIHPDLADVYVDEILNRCAAEVIRRYENPEGFQLAQNRKQEEE